MMSLRGNLGLLAGSVIMCGVSETAGLRMRTKLRLLKKADIDINGEVTEEGDAAFIEVAEAGQIVPAVHASDKAEGAPDPIKNAIYLSLQCIKALAGTYVQLRAEGQLEGQVGLRKSTTKCRLKGLL